MAKTDLTRAQHKCLSSLTDDWRNEGRDWKAGRTFLDLEARGLCEWKDEYVGSSTIRTGPGFHGAYDYLTRITPEGRAAISSGDHQ